MTDVTTRPNGIQHFKDERVNLCTKPVRKCYTRKPYGQ